MQMHTPAASPRADRLTAGALTPEAATASAWTASDAPAPHTPKPIATPAWHSPKHP